MYEFSARVWLYEGDAAWHFLTLPGELSDDIRMRTAGTRRGFGSVRVAVTIGSTRWHTSIFPDKASGAHVLPLKQEVRRAEGVVAGDTVTVQLDVVAP